MKNRNHNRIITLSIACAFGLLLNTAASAQSQYTDEACLLAVGSTGTGKKVGSTGTGKKVGSTGTGKKVGSTGTGKKVGSTGTGEPESICQTQNKSFWNLLFR